MEDGAGLAQREGHAPAALSRRGPEGAGASPRASRSWARASRMMAHAERRNKPATVMATTRSGRRVVGQATDPAATTVAKCPAASAAANRNTARADVSWPACRA